MILAIESSVPEAGLALYDRGKDAVVWSRGFTSQRAHNAVIFEPLTEALAVCDRSLELIVIGRGPGSYGGVRVGIAVANGLSLALGAPVIGISSLEAMDTDAETYAVIGDARRQSWFLAHVSDGALRGEPDLLTQEGLVADLTLLSERRIPVFTADRALADAYATVSHTLPTATRLAARAARLDPAAIGRLKGEPLEPHYLRAPYITAPRA